MKTTELSLSFPQTFMADRDLLARLLHHALDGGSGTKEVISEETGIPTGKSTGKVEPMIHYARGMGLVYAEKASGVWSLQPTPLGREIWLHDASLNESVTLWLLHLLLCRRSGLDNPARGIADAWFALFADGASRLGNRFTQPDYLAVLLERHGNKACLNSLSSLVLRTYLEPRGWGNIGALTRDEGTYTLQSAPCQPKYFPAYASYFCIVCDNWFAGSAQLGLAAFKEQSRFMALTGWDDAQTNDWLDWMVARHIVQLDRHTGTPVLLRLADTDRVLAELYQGLV